MPRLHTVSAALLLSVMLAGCGSAPAMLQSTALTSNGAAFQADAESIVADKQAQGLISAYQAVQGSDQAALAQRSQLIAKLGTTNSDQAANFLEAQYDGAKTNFPAAVQQNFKAQIMSSLINLDTYDYAADDAAINQAATSGQMGAQAVTAAATRKKRHNGFIRWATTPLHWLDEGLRWFLREVNGNPGHARKPGGGGNGPGPAPAPGPVTPPGPAPAGM